MGSCWEWQEALQFGSRAQGKKSDITHRSSRKLFQTKSVFFRSHFFFFYVIDVEYFLLGVILWLLLSET